MSYRSRMALTFALTTVITVLILVGVVAVVWGSAFSEYTRSNVEDIAEQIAENLAEGYEDEGEWTYSNLVSAVDAGSFSGDIGVQVTDADGAIIYDDTWSDDPVASGVARDEASEASEDEAASEGEGAEGDAVEGEGSAEGAEAAEADDDDPVSTAPTSQESIVTVSIETSDGEVVGEVHVWVVGSDALLTQADTAFRNRTFNAMALAALISVIISVIIGFTAASSLTKPVGRVTATARRIRDGDLSARTGMRGDDEIDQLGETFDEMATSLEKDLKHERRITSDVAHELRTPLMAILATVEAMQDGVLPADEEHLETVASETRRLSRLVQQMLDLSRHERKSVPMNPEPVDMVAFARNIVNTQHPLFKARGLHLRFEDDTQGKDAVANVDPDMITQAIVNIMSNAMRYTPEDGWVVVKVTGDRRDVVVSISDTGIGIAKEDLPRIFGRFWRADASRAREAGGLGVGLSVTKQIVERHHGYIAVESELEKGTTFRIHLPREYTGEGSSTTMNR